MKKIKIKNIRTDGGTQTRAELNQDIINQYADLMLEEIEFPAVTIFYDGTEYWLADGFHRLRASEKAGFIEIESDIKQGTQRDAIWYSLGANKDHGLRRNSDDKKRAIETILKDKEWAKISLTKIAEHIGVTQQYISKIKSQLTTSCKLPDRSIIKCKDGRIRNIANIGKSQGIKKQTQLDIVPDENIQEEEKKPNEEKESFIPTGKPADEYDHVKELVSEMYDTILRRFIKLKKDEKQRAVNLLITDLKNTKL